MMRPVSVADMGLSRLIVVVAAATLWPLVGGAPVGRWHGLAGFASRRPARAATRRLGGWRLFALPGRPGRPGPTGALGDRLDDLGLRRPGVPRSRRCGALGRFGAAGGACGRLAGLGGPGRTLDGVPATG